MDLILKVPSEFANLNIFNSNNEDFIINYNLNRFSGHFKKIFKDFISYSCKNSNFIHLSENLNKTYQHLCKEHRYWGSITKEIFHKLTPVTAVTFKEGIFIVDGKHRVTIYSYKNDFDLKFRIIYSE